MKIDVIKDKDLMTPQDKLRESLNYQVAKSNDLIFESRDNLTNQEYRIVLNMISRQNPYSDTLKPVQYDIEDLAMYLGIDITSRTNIARLYEEVKNITSKKFWLYKTEHKMVTASWVKQAEVDRFNRTVLLTFDEELTDHLTGLQGRFTTFQLLFMSLITNKHYMILYELLNGHLIYGHKRIIDIEIEVLRERMLEKTESDSKYATVTGKFTQLIDRAIADINKKTNLKVEVERIKKGRKIKCLRFTIIEKTIKEQEVLKESYFQYGNRKFISNTTDYGYSEEIYLEHKQDIDKRVSEALNKEKKKKKAVAPAKKEYELEEAEEKALNDIFPEKESDEVPGDMLADAEREVEKNPQLQRGTRLPVMNWLHDEDVRDSILKREL